MSGALIAGKIRTFGSEAVYACSLAGGQKQDQARQRYACRLRIGGLDWRRWVNRRNGSVQRLVPSSPQTGEIETEACSNFNPAADQVASVGAYTIIGTRARAALRKADDSGVCRLDMSVVFSALAVLLDGLPEIPGEGHMMLRCGCTGCEPLEGQGPWPWHRDQTERGDDRTTGDVPSNHTFASTS